MKSRQRVQQLHEADLRSKKGEVPLRQRVSIVDWQGWFGLAKKAAVQTTAMRIVDWQGWCGLAKKAAVQTTAMRGSRRNME